MSYFETRVDARDLLKMARDARKMAAHFLKFGDIEMASSLSRDVAGIAANIRHGRSNTESRGFRLVFKEGVPPS